MQILVHVCNICEEQFTKDRNTRCVILNGQVFDVCSAQCAFKFWERTYWQSSEISIITTAAAAPAEVKEFKVIK